MRFPGSRNPKHYFPVSAARRTRVDREGASLTPVQVLIGLDQVLVDLEVCGPEALGRELGFVPGESARLGPDGLDLLVARIHTEGLDVRYAPGGTVANSLNNYTCLADEPASLLGTIQSSIEYGSPAFQYVARTTPALDLSHLASRAGRVGIAVTWIFENGERSFAVAPGVSNHYAVEDVPEEVVRQGSALVCSLYTLADPDAPIAAATRHAMAVASEAGVPVAFGLGTAGLVAKLRPEVRSLLERYVDLAAMNEREAEALTGLSDPFLAAHQILEWVDIVILTMGAEGMIIGGWSDGRARRRTNEPVLSASVPDYNLYEYSRLVRRVGAQDPEKVFAHVHPYQGGPDRLVNTNGAGDAALAAVLHDVAANRYHLAMVPDSDKHREDIPFLTYSSLSRNAQYGNRVAYEVLRRASPRLDGAVGSDVAAPDA